MIHVLLVVITHIESRFTFLHSGAVRAERSGTLLRVSLMEERLLSHDPGPQTPERSGDTFSTRVINKPNDPTRPAFQRPHNVILKSAGSYELTRTLCANLS